jgi:hypothetical protein
MAQTRESNRLRRTGFCIKLGHVDSAEERWWRAVLALGQSWRANAQPPLFYSPWSVSYAGDPPFFMTSSTTKPSRRDLQPPSFEDAYDYFLRFCCCHNLGGQVRVAMIALTLPYHNLLRYQNLSLHAGLMQDHGVAHPLTKGPFIPPDHLLAPFSSTD